MVYSLLENSAGVTVKINNINANLLNVFAFKNAKLMLKNYIIIELIFLQLTVVKTFFLRCF